MQPSISCSTIFTKLRESFLQDPKLTLSSLLDKADAYERSQQQALQMASLTTSTTKVISSSQIPLASEVNKVNEKCGRHKSSSKPRCFNCG